MVDCLVGITVICEIIPEGVVLQEIRSVPPVRAWDELVENINAPVIKDSNKPGDEKKAPESPTEDYMEEEHTCLPPRMELSQTSLDFGIVTQPNTYLYIIIRNTGGSTWRYH